VTEKRFRIIFMGSPDFAVPSLRAVAGRHDVLAVVTQPDRPQGRGRAVAPPPVKSVALELGIEVLQPEKLRRRSVREHLMSYGADLFVVVAYGKILRPKMLAVPRMGCINVHASLLPKYRGAAPIHWAVIEGEKRSGVSIMQMDEGMDTGPVYLQREIDLQPDETAGSLHDRLAPLGAEALLETLEGLLRGELEPSPQPEHGESLAPMLSKEDGLVDFSLPATVVDSRVRGMDPWPGAYTFLEGKRLKLFASRAVGDQGGRPGEVLTTDAGGLLVACGEGALRVTELQLPGRKRLPVQALVAGRPIPAGAVLGTGGAGSAEP
jgi:methionyl-tRNA formyltransferase